ncbi:major facilitator superfamily domain-containing protein [Boletus edulis]|nr:major facilitator superfamily domain-containing protein [Boletus edulis]
MIGGSLLQSFALFMLSLAQPGQYYQIFLAQGIAQGIAQGTLYVPTVAVVSHHFHKRRTLAMSLVASGTPLGAIVHPVMLNNLLTAAAAFISILLLIACLLIRTRLEPPNVPQITCPSERVFCTTCRFVSCVLGKLLFFQMGFYYPLFYFQIDSVKHGNSETFSFYSLVLLNGGNLIGRLSAGFIASRVGVPRLIILSTAVCAILIFGMIGLNRVATVVVLGTIYGYFAGTYITMLPPTMTLLTSDFSEIGARMGIGMTMTGFGSLLGGPISGALLTSQYKWWQPSLFNGLISLTGCGMLIIMQLALTRRKRSAETQEP